MNRKLLSIPLIAFMIAIILPIATVQATVPNADHIYTVTIGMPETVDPAWAYDTASGELIQNVYEPLCIFNTTKADEFMPAVADWWPGYGTNPGNSITPLAGWNGSDNTFLFKIREGIPWQDGSGTVSAADVEYSIERGMLMDHTAGPQWMFYEPLLVGASSYDYDGDGDGTLNETEYLALDADIDNAIQNNGTHVWFNLGQPYSPFQQILSQTWAVIMDDDWCKAQGLWNGQHGNYTEFLRTWDPPEPGPLMNPAKAMGSGPFSLKAMNEDPHTGWFTLYGFSNYWRGWPAPAEFFNSGVAAANNVTFSTVKTVEEWPNRKAQFFSTDPSLQADFCAVPRPNTPELHPGGNITIDPLPGFRVFKKYDPILYAVYYTFDVKSDSPYPPKFGNDTVKLDLFKDRDLRIAMNYMVNFTTIINDVYLGEAIQSPVCMPDGTAFFNASKPKYDIDVAKATTHLMAAWGGQLWNVGMKITLCYNTGNVMRQTTAEMMAYNLENSISWPGSAVVDIETAAVPWSIFLPGMKNQQYVTFIVGWLADFPDPHNWLMPFMHPSGTYSGRQKVQYGLDPASLTANWYAGATYVPPYTNVLGDYVASPANISNTYIAHLIDTAVGETYENRHMLYEELFDIYYAEATQLPMCYALSRHYERTWMHGYNGTFSEMALAPGFFFYTMWKAPDIAPQSVDVAAYTLEMSPENNITTYLINRPYHAPRPGIPWIKLNFTTDASVPIVLSSAKVKYYNVSGPDVLVYVTWTGITPNGHAEEFHYAVELISAGGSITLGPGDLSDVMPAVGDYNLWTFCYVLSEFAFNVNVTKDFFASWFNATGFCDISFDLVVDGQDFQLVKRAVPSAPGGAKWRWMADVNSDGIVDGTDYQLVKTRVGKVSYEKA